MARLVRAGFATTLAPASAVSGDMLAGLRAVPVDDSRLCWTLSAAVCTDRRMTAATAVLLDARTRGSPHARWNSLPALWCSSRCFRSHSSLLSCSGQSAQMLASAVTGVPQRDGGALHRSVSFARPGFCALVHAMPLGTGALMSPGGLSRVLAPGVLTWYDARLRATRHDPNCGTRVFRS